MKRTMYQATRHTPKRQAVGSNPAGCAKRRACCRKQLLRHAHFANESREKQWHSVKEQPAKAIFYTGLAFDEFVSYLYLKRKDEVWIPLWGSLPRLFLRGCFATRPPCLAFFCGGVLQRARFSLQKFPCRLPFGVS